MRAFFTTALFALGFALIVAPRPAAADDFR
jgi:hypothetical protein